MLYYSERVAGREDNMSRSSSLLIPYGCSELVSLFLVTSVITGPGSGR
jgi:hypothetical protein